MKYLYCIPRGGFNDTLCQIRHMWRYARKNKRMLVIDTRKSCLKDHFDHYFECSARNVLLRATDELLAVFDRLNVYPGCLAGRVSSHEARLDRELDRYVEHDSGETLSFDFAANRKYAEELLVHHDWGGGRTSMEFLSRLKFAPKARKLILDAFKEIGTDYYAVHVRNSDLATDYRRFFKAIYPEVTNRRLLVCSDDWACREYARSFFNESEVLFATDIPNTQGRPLHGLAGEETMVFKHNLDMLLDLMALARSRRLFIAKLRSGGYSGFSRLAELLFYQKHVVSNLLY